MNQKKIDFYLDNYVNSDKVGIVKDTIEIAGLETAFRGMRNPKNSWHLADSSFTRDIIELGQADLNLAQTLITAGGEHRKFLRQIYIGFDLVFPRYVWSEFDTYGWCPKNSCSTMHKLFNKQCEVTLDQFVYNRNKEEKYQSKVGGLNELRYEYFKATTQLEKDDILLQAKQELPEAFLQKRTIATNYEVLKNIVHQRDNHRLPEWHILCRDIKELPFADELIFYN